MKKTSIIAMAVFAALLAAVLLTREKQVSVGMAKLDLPPLGDVLSIEVSGAHQAKLISGAKGWEVSGHPADQSQVTSFLDALKEFRGGDFVTDKAERHAELEVDDAKGTKAVVIGKSGTWQLIFGKAGKASGSYVRDAKSNAVFATSSPITYQVKRGVSAWRQHSITTAPAADIERLKMARPDGAYTLLNVEGAWKLESVPSGFRFDAEAAKRLAEQTASLHAQDFAEGADSSEPQATIELSLKGGKTLALRLGAKRSEGTVPLTVEGDPQVYLLAQWTADQLLKKVDDLRDTSLMSFEAEKVKKLSIVAKGKTVTLAKDGTAWKVVEPKVVPAGQEPDVAVVGQQLLRFRTMRALRAVSGVTDAAAGLTKPTATLELVMEGGKKELLRFGGETPTKELYVRGSADGLLYAIGAHERASLESGLDLFKKRPPPDPNMMRGLDQLPPDVRRKLEAQLRSQGGG